ncbi:hypothetical protein ACIQNG_37425 [Streptomyces sp. NPDC091377]|uniref:hypothetical protein n=1 Tax=Streptomyces sp. NPDC091377 TaxID=3365995 RepID=UPI0037F2EA72
MDLDVLRNADFKPLDEAVKDWSTLVKSLESLKTDAEDELHQAANRADWAGVNAQVTKEFIGKTAGEFSDAHSQARTIHRVLEDTRNELKEYHRQLTEAIEGGRRRDLTVVGREGGFTVAVAGGDGRQGEGGAGAGDQTAVTSLRDQIQRILDQATESDDSAQKILKAIADQSRLGFTEVDYNDREAAQEALRKAAELARLAGRNPESLSVREFDLLNKGLAQYADDELFAEAFATALGPQGTLEFWAGVSDPRRANYELEQQRLDQFDDLQRHLGLTLAHATQSDSVAMSEWKRTMIDIGDKPLTGGSGPVGFQVMSNLMRTGDYDDQFLKDYGTRLMATERELTGNGEREASAWRHDSADPWLNRIGEDSGSDPFTGFLKGLSNSPDAATDFFNQEFISRSDPDNPFQRDTDGNGREGKVTLSNFQYLFEERQWPRETSLTGEELNTGKNTLGLALEAATTGHPAGELPNADTPAHNPEQTKLMESLVASIADDPERLTNSTYMSDSIGQITSEYLPDINRAISTVERSPGAQDWEGVARMYPIAGSEAVFEHTAVSQLLFTIGQNPEGYAAVEVGQKAYLGRLFDYHLNPDLPADLRITDNYEALVEPIASRSGEISGTLGLGAKEYIGEQASEKDKEYAHSVAQRKNLISGTIGTGVAVGASFLATPWVGAAAGGFAATTTSMILETVFKDAEGNAVANATKTGGQVWQEGWKQNTTITDNAARSAAEKYDLDGAEIATTARESARQGYLNSQAILEGQIPGILAGE